MINLPIQKAIGFVQTFIQVIFEKGKNINDHY